MGPELGDIGPLGLKENQDIQRGLRAGGDSHHLRLQVMGSQGDRVPMTQVSVDEI